MSMCKDRIRFVSVSKHHPSPPHVILTTARVGPYHHIITIYVPYIYGGTAPDLPPLYFGSWISTDPQVPKSHQPPNPQTHLYHRLIRPLTQRATLTTTIDTSQYWQPQAHHLPINCVCDFTIIPPSKW